MTLSNKHIPIKHLPLNQMLRKYASILMMFTALAILLGHDVIEHHHHDFAERSVEHGHHSEDHQHEDDGGNEEFGIGHFFSNFQHGENGVTFLTNHDGSNSGSKYFSLLVAVLPEGFVLQHITEFVRQNSPPYKSFYPNSQYLLPTGLRAPPTFIA